MSHFPVKVPLRGSIKGYLNKTKIKRLRLRQIIPPTTIYLILIIQHVLNTHPICDNLDYCVNYVMFHRLPKPCRALRSHQDKHLIVKFSVTVTPDPYFSYDCLFFSKPPVFLTQSLL